MEVDKTSKHESGCEDPYKFADKPFFSDKPVKIDVIHPEWKIDVKISNDNTKGEKRVTVHYRSDSDDIKKVVKKAHEMYVEELGS